MTTRERTVTQKFDVCDICDEICRGSWTIHTLIGGKIVQHTCSIKCEEAWQKKRQGRPDNIKTCGMNPEDCTGGEGCREDMGYSNLCSECGCRNCKRSLCYPPEVN